jgi:hypothetical protein
MQIAINRQASEGVKLTSSRFAIDSLDRSYRIVDSADIHASRPNCNFAPSVTYHNNAVTINKYVEAEQRTMLRRACNRALSVCERQMLERKIDGRAKIRDAAGAVR